MKWLIINLFFFATWLGSGQAKAQSDVLRTGDSLSLVTVYNNAGGSGWINKAGWLTNTPITNWYGVTTTQIGSSLRVTGLSLPSNNLTGTLVIDGLYELQVLDVHNNPLPGGSSDYSRNTKLTWIDASNTNMGMPSGIGNLTNLISLNLKGNGIIGSIPSSISNCTKLQVLYLHLNKFTGSIPYLGGMTALIDLRLSDNQLTGPIPSEVVNLTNLQILDFVNNQLTGSIPTGIGNLTNLTFLGLGPNQLSGTIPTSIGNLSALQLLSLRNNQLTGSVPSELWSLTNLKFLYLSFNQFTGTIPTQIGNLTLLKALWLNNNLLTGSIPTQIGNLTQLTDFALSFNSLSGTVPSQITNLTNLNYLHLEHNLLSGLPDIHSMPVFSVANNLVDVDNNLLSFADIEPNRNIPTSKFIYAPQQDVIGVPITLSAPQPISLSFTVGGSANSYQWQKNGTDIPGATASTYSKASAFITDAGTYTLIVNNSLVPSLTIKRSVVLAVNQPILKVVQGGNPIQQNGTFDFGNVSTSANSGDIIFYDSNTGNTTLNINLASSTLTGANAADFTLDLSGLNSTIAPNAAYPVKVRFTPSGLGLRTATVSVASDDPVNNPYIITLKGTGVVTTPSSTPATNITTTGFTANWSATIGATGYQLDISTDNFTTFVAGYNSKTETGTTDVVAGLTAGTTYQYRVRAVNGSGVSANSDIVSVITITDAPVATAASTISATGFTANWSVAIGATGYQLDISTDNFTTFVAGYNSKTETGTTDAVSGLIAGTTYQYRVRATNASGPSASSNVITATTNKLDQTITFAALADVTLGDPGFNPGATANSGLAVTYTSSTPKVTVNGNIVTIVGAGRTSIKASQAGNANYNAATDVTQSFCIKPAKPTITEAGNNTATPTLTSSASSGNQWFKDGAALSGATSNTLSVTSPGVYTVQAKVDDCASAVSANFPIIVTGDIRLPEAVGLFPNPSRDFVFVTGIKETVTESGVVDVIGRSTPIKLEQQGNFLKGDISNLSSGIYMLRITVGHRIHQLKFIKQ